MVSFLLIRHWQFKRASALGMSLLVPPHQLPEMRTSQMSTNQWHQHPLRNKCQPPTRWQRLLMKLSSCPFWWPRLFTRSWSKSKMPSKMESLHPNIEWSLVSMVILSRSLWSIGQELMGWEKDCQKNSKSYIILVKLIDMQTPDI